MHFYGHTRIKRALPFIYFDGSSTDSQWNRWLSFRNRLVRRLAKIAEANPDFNPVHFIKHKLAGGRKSLNAVAIEDWIDDLEDRSVQLRLRVKGDDVLIGGDFSSLDDAEAGQ